MPVNVYVEGLGDVSIPDDVPSNQVRAYVNSLAQKQGINLPPPRPLVEPGGGGVIESLVGGTKRLLSSQLTGLQTPFIGGTEAAKRGLEREEGITESPAADFGEVSRKYEQEGLLPAAKELVSQVPSALAEWAPFGAESWASAKVGARLGAMAGAPFEGVGAIPGAIIGGGIGLFAPSFLASLGGDVQRQAQVQLEKGAPVDVDTLAATGAAIPQGLLDSVGLRFTFGKSIIGKMVGMTDEQIAKSTEKTLEKKLRALAEEGGLKTLGKGTIQGLAAEIPTEVTQQVLERWQAGLPLADADAFKEYGETAYAVGLMSPAGAIGRFSEKGGARQELGRREAVAEFERSNPDAAQIVHPMGSKVEPAGIVSATNQFLSGADRNAPAFGLGYIVNQTGDNINTEGDAAAVANELLKRGEIVQEGGTAEAPEFRFLKDEERIVPHLDETQPYLYASPVTRESEETTAEGYEVSNAGIGVTRKAKTPEEADNIKTQMDARVGRMTAEIDKQIKDLNDTADAVKANLNVALASDMTDEELAAEHDSAAEKIGAVNEQIAKLQEDRAKIAQETAVTPIGEAAKTESGYEVRLYRPGQTAKTLMPFGNREQAEQFILQNAPAAQQQAIFEDQAPHRGSLRETQKKMYMPGEAAPETAPETAPEAAGEAVEQTGVPEPTPEMQQRVQAVTSSLRGALDRMGLKNIGVNVAGRLSDMVNGKMTPIDGMYLNRVISVSLSSQRGVLKTFGHEVVHALREMGMFSDKEWEILSKKAKDEWIKKYGTEKKYSHLNPEEQIEEAIADAFGDWAVGEYKPTGVIRGLLNRMKLFFESVGSVFRGQGFDNTEKIFTRATRGELRGARKQRAEEGARYAFTREQKDQQSRIKFNDKLSITGFTPKAKYALLQHASPASFEQVDAEKLKNFLSGFGVYTSVTPYSITEEQKRLFEEDATRIALSYAKESGYVYVADIPLTKENTLILSGNIHQQKFATQKLIDAGLIEKRGNDYFIAPEYAKYLLENENHAIEVPRHLLFGLERIIPRMMKLPRTYAGYVESEKIISKMFSDAGFIASISNPQGHDSVAVVLDPDLFNRNMVGKYEVLPNNSLYHISGMELEEENYGDDYQTILRHLRREKRLKGFEVNVEDLPDSVERRAKHALPLTDRRIKHAVSLTDYDALTEQAKIVMESDFLYSPLNRMVSNAPSKLDNQSATNWLQWIKSNSSKLGVKQTEIDWTGLEEWLAAQGKERVTKEQIGKYLEDFDNPRDVVYEAAGRPDIGVIDVTDQLPEQVDPMGDPVDAAYELIVNVGGNEFSFVVYESADRDNIYPFDLYDVNNEFVQSFPDLDSVKEHLLYEANESLGVQGDTKYSQWTLDGGDNYREIPVVLSGPSAKKIEFDFYGTHWDDANVLYHLRTNDRKDVLGRNILFVEEIQSDWAQSGRDLGFSTTEQKRERDLKRFDIQQQIERNQSLINRATSQDSIEFLREKNKILNREYKKLESIPFGPYVQETGQWLELALKRIVAMAVSGGYDGVAFITPEQAHIRFPETKEKKSTKEGFESFYGNMLPNKLNSVLGKGKYNSKVEIFEFPTIGDKNKWGTDSDTSQQLGFVVTPELAASVRQNGFPKYALPLNVLSQGERKPSLNANGQQIHPMKNGVRNFWRWFGDGKLVDSVGRPRVFYHGSLKNIEAFKTGTADAIFFAPSTFPADVFVTYKNVQIHGAVSYYKSVGDERNMGVVYPVYINAKNVFDYENPQHVDALVNEVMKGAKTTMLGAIKRAVLHPYYSIKTHTGEGDVEEEFFVAPESIKEPLKFSKEGLREKLMQGYWPVFETGEVINAIKKLGHDGFFITEMANGQFYKNVAVFSPNQIKSAVGNNGLFEPQDPRIKHALSLPRKQAINSINAASRVPNPRQDPMFAVPFSSPQAGINVFNRGMLNAPTVQKNKGMVQKFLMNYGHKGLQFFQLSGLVDVFGDNLPQLRTYYNTIRHMMGARDIYIHDSTEISERWQRLNARSLQDGNNMATVMNRATFYRYDPSNDAGNKNKRAPKTPEEMEIQRMFDALPKPYKDLYVDVRNFYRKRFEDFFKMLEKRVNDSVKDPQRAKDVVEEIKKKYNYYNQIEPYFPLTRFGEYWVRYTEGGQVKYEMFENASDQDAFRTKIMTNPQISDINWGKKLSSLQGEIGASDFVDKIMKTLDEAKGGYMGQGQIEDIKDSVWQLYLSNLPELSMRKQFLHRANVLGYSNDALRAFQKNSFHGAYHMARLQYGYEAAKTLNDIRQRVQQMQTDNHPDAVWATEVFNSVSSEQRQKQIWRPDDTSAPFRIAGQVGFLYYLSTAASAVTNLSQNFTHAFPIMGSEFGYDKATKEFARAYKQFFESPSLDDFSDIINTKSKTEALLQADKGIRSIFDMTRTLEQLRKEATTQAEKDKYTREIDAIHYLYQTVISRSQAMDLAGATDKVTMSTNWFQVGMRFIAMAFHGAEILNRTTTGIVAYRLQMEKLAKEQPGLTIDQRQQMAVQRASEIVDQSHYNYSEANRSEFMGSMGNLGKVIFMFKSYAVAETTFLYNALRVWTKVLRARWKGTPLEQKAIDDSRKAGRMLLGVLGMQATFAGMLGLPTPLMMIVMGLANMMGGDDDDEDKDIPAEVKFKQWLVETFGDNLAQAIAYGPVSYMTGADFNSRIGLNNLWFRDPNPAEDELDQVKDWWLSMGGPLVGLTTNVVQGAVMMQQGEIWRGAEKMIPNVVKSPFQAIRFAREGATTAKGDTILDEVSTSEQALTFFGFTPIRLSMTYKQQSEKRGAMFKESLAKKRILMRFNLAVKSGDFDAIDEIREDIFAYNDKYPSDPITFDTLQRSIKATQSSQKEMQDGLRIPKKQRAITEGVSWLNLDEED